MIRRGEPQIGLVCHPISDIKIEASPPFDPFFGLFWKVGMAQDNDLKSFFKFLMRKKLKSRGHPLGAGRMIFLTTLATHLQCDATAPARTCKLDQTKHPAALNDPPEASIFPLDGIREVSMGNKRPSSPQTLLTTIWMNFDLHLKPVLEEGMEKEVMISFEILDSNPLSGESFEAFKNGKVFREWERL